LIDALLKDATIDLDVLIETLGLALFAAVAYGHAECADFILKLVDCHIAIIKQDVLLKKFFGETSLFVAASRGDAGCAAVLLRHATPKQSAQATFEQQLEEADRENHVLSPLTESPAESSVEVGGSFRPVVDDFGDFVAPSSSVFTPDLSTAPRSPGLQAPIAGAGREREARRARRLLLPSKELLKSLDAAAAGFEAGIDAAPLCAALIDALVKRTEARAAGAALRPLAQRLGLLLSTQKKLHVDARAGAAALRARIDALAR